MSRLKQPRFLFFLIPFAAAVSCTQPTERAFEDWDLDGNSQIDQDEFNQSWTSEGYWNLYDRNNDGVIDLEEWNKGLEEYYDKFDRERLGEYIDLDVDKSGSLDEEELAQGSFVIWDTNGDGRIDSTEFRERSFQSK